MHMVPRPSKPSEGFHESCLSEQSDDAHFDIPNRALRRPYLRAWHEALASVRTIAPASVATMGLICRMLEYKKRAGRRWRTSEPTSVAAPLAVSGHSSSPCSPRLSLPSSHLQCSFLELMPSLERVSRYSSISLNGLCILMSTGHL